MWRICYAKSSVYVTLFLCTFQEKDPALAEKIEEFIARLKTLKEVEEEFTLVSLADSKLQKNSIQLTKDETLLLIMRLEVMNTLMSLYIPFNTLKWIFDIYVQIIDDPSGNSFIENPFAPQKDTALTVTHYKRTPEQNAALGIEVRSCYSVENCKVSVSSTIFVSF